MAEDSSVQQGAEQGFGGVQGCWQSARARGGGGLWCAGARAKQGSAAGAAPAAGGGGLWCAGARAKQGSAASAAPAAGGSGSGVSRDAGLI